MKRVLGPAAVLALLPLSATAQQMEAQSSNTVNVMAITGPQTDVPTRQEVVYGGHTWTTPSAQGSYFGGANPCLIGSGGGAAGGPIAFNINVGKSDEGCQRRSDAAAWHAMGFDNVAVARMCQDIKSADAFFAATGEVCPGAMATRYKLADGSSARPAALVANSRAIPGNQYSGPVDLTSPQVQAAIRAEAAKMLRSQSNVSAPPPGASPSIGSEVPLMRK
ncbi:MAG: hypothetical protein V3V60_16560 [Sphingomonas aquatilis]|uniref:hypothetical protein n=1 Tax=Sphingomonas aquatilis TaxID=93063 RepID=UPI002F31C559